MATTLIEELAIWDVELEQLTSAGDIAFRYGALRAHLDTLYRLDLIDDAERRERQELGKRLANSPCVSVSQAARVYAGLSDPLRQCRTRDSQTRTAKDLLLPVQRQMIGVFGHHDMSQQAGSRDALVDHLGWYRRLDQCFALAAGPLATHMLFDGEHARRVIQLFADVFADALQRAAAGALSVLRLVTDHSTRKLGWQRRALGLLAGFSRSRRRIEGFQFRLDGGDVRVEQIIQQAALFRA